MTVNSKFSQYFREYKWSNIFAMIRNSSRKPKICKDDFKNRLVVITGATSGIGYCAARKYASQGANLLAINRNAQKSEALKLEIERDFPVKCDYLISDLSIIKDIKDAARKLLLMKRPIDVLIHNAGIYLSKKAVTVDGLERVFVVNHLASFIINYVIRRKLKRQVHSRIIFVNSEGHRFAVWGLRLDDLNWEKRAYSGLGSYGSAKTAQLLSMIVLNDYFEDTGVVINAMHPGAVKTETGRDNGPVYLWFRKNFYDKILGSPEISAEALYYLGVSSEIEGVSGRFFNLTTEEEPAPPALDNEIAHELWKKSLQLAGLPEPI